MAADVTSDANPTEVVPIDQPLTVLEVQQVSPPRVWPVFAVYALAFCATIGAQVVVVIGIVLWKMAQGTKQNELQPELLQAVTEPITFIILMAFSQMAIGCAAAIPARLSPQKLSFRLGLLKPVLAPWAYPIVVLGTLGPFAVGIGGAYLVGLVLPGDQSIALLYSQMTWLKAIPFVLFIALAPGFMEELLFRGYMQRRLLERWSPAKAISIISVLFAIMHISPPAIIFALPLGFWLGFVAWRTGSVWPGMLCHAFINGAWNIWQISHLLADPGTTVSVILAVTIMSIGLICFFGSIFLLRRNREPAPQVIE